jgi:pyruvate dehydrogenase E2 component (dihydrolipoamide acetyltransferase)
MATKVFMEALSPTMEEGRLVKWNVPAGATVKSGDILAEVETDKAVMELVARGDGVLRVQLLPEGSTAAVGTLVGVIAAESEDISALTAGAAAAATPSAAPAAPAADVAAPASAPVAVSPAAPAPRAPAVPAPRPAAPAPRSEQAPHAAESAGILMSPLARRLAQEGGLDVAAMRGTGPGGRIIKRDIETALAAPVAAVAARQASGADFDDVPLTQMRKTIAKRLSESIGPIPTFYLTAELDLGRVMEMRAAMAAMGDGFKVSVNDVLMKAIATALAQHPECNAHWLGDKIRYYNRVHLGMAVATDDGLIVPVIFDADQKRMSEISAEAKALAKKARERKLTPAEYTGSTFSVSNLGMFGIDQFTAIINPPEAAILAIGSAEQKPVLVDGEEQWRTRVRVTMSCDHRVIDGAVGAKFLQTLRRLVENPLMLVF